MQLARLTTRLTWNDDYVIWERLLAPLFPVGASFSMVCSYYCRQGRYGIDVCLFLADRTYWYTVKVRVKVARTRIRALGSELIPVIASPPAGDIVIIPGSGLPFTFRQACSYLSSHRASPPSGRYQIVLHYCLVTEASVWTTCPESLWPVHTGNKVAENGNKLLPETATLLPFPAGCFRPLCCLLWTGP